MQEEIRKTIISVVGENGGHLASNLGVVELTVALHRVFSSPEDAIVWDVSHQCYAHKLLTGRYPLFSELRKKDGLSGFTKKTESPHDFFDNGHASTSISQALWLLTAWNLRGKKGKVIAVIGDGALTGGMAFEGLCNAGELGENLIIVLNDNQMSIDKNDGTFSRYLSRLTMTGHYQSIRRAIDFIVSRLPFSHHLQKFVFRFKRGLKGLLLQDNFFSDLDFEYVGPLDGHDEKSLETVLKRVKKMRNPVVVHVVTKKGKGYSPAEDNPERFHGIGPFCTSDGKVEKFDAVSFTESFSNSLLNFAEKNKNLVAITASMAKGTGLDSFARHYPERFFDVGIAEEHAVTFAGGLSRGGMIPVVCIYSTFMQRAVDQVIHDMAIQNLHSIIVMDRAGAVPGDGETHQGLFDIALFRPVPNVTMLTPATGKDLEKILEYSISGKGTYIIRYPKMSCPSERPEFSSEIIEGRGVLLKAESLFPTLKVALEDSGETRRILFVTTGGMYSEVVVASRALLMENVMSDIYSLRFIKPIDKEYFIALAKDYDGIVFAEDGIVSGGISEYLALVLSQNKITNFRIKAFPEGFYRQGSRADVLSEAGLGVEELRKAALELLGIL